MDPALQELLDKQAITEVLARYARTLDWLDRDAATRQERRFGTNNDALRDDINYVGLRQRRWIRTWAAC